MPNPIKMMMLLIPQVPTKLSYDWFFVTTDYVPVREGERIPEKVPQSCRNVLKLSQCAQLMSSTSPESFRTIGALWPGLRARNRDFSLFRDPPSSFWAHLGNLWFSQLFGAGSPKCGVGHPKRPGNPEAPNWNYSGLKYELPGTTLNHFPKVISAYDFSRFCYKYLGFCTYLSELDHMSHVETEKWK